MAIFISGMRCLLCQFPIDDQQDKVGFRPFVANELDPLYLFSDQIFHEDCFRKHPLSEKALTRYQNSQQLIEANNRVCAVCKQEITNPDDCLYFPYLAGNISDPLHQYNHIQVHYSCLSLWSGSLKVYQLLLERKNAETWKGRALDYLLKKMKKALVK